MSEKNCSPIDSRSLTASSAVLLCNQFLKSYSKEVFIPICRMCINAIKVLASYSANDVYVLLFRGGCECIGFDQSVNHGLSQGKS